MPHIDARIDALDQFECGHSMQGKRADLREMYAEWPFFQSTIDLIEMILAKADMRIAELYDATLVTDPAHRRLGARIRQHFHATVDAVLQASPSSQAPTTHAMMPRLAPSPHQESVRPSHARRGAP